MNTQLIQSVIEITKQRDIDSLEYSLVISLAEMLPADSISMYKMISDKSSYIIEKTTQLDIENAGSNDSKFNWNDNPGMDDFDDELRQCLKTVSPLNYSIESDQTRYLFPIAIDNIAVGILSIDCRQETLTNNQTIETLLMIYENYLFILNESERDKLTGLYNRRTFDKKLARMLRSQASLKEQYLVDENKVERRHTEKDSNAWLALIDFDNFKHINDTYGHVYGDEVLLTFSQKMKEYFRESDLLFRFGGDEFVIVLEPVPSERADHTLDHFRKEIEEHAFPFVGNITISIGYAKITEKDYPPDILDRADKALYQAKLCGRNGTHNYEILQEKGAFNEPKKTGAIDLF